MSRPFLFAILVLLLHASAHAGAEPPDFATVVLPVLTREGCNSGQCHGAATGQGGFRLSLLGYDPEADHAAIVRDYEGRRVNVVRPERSLLLLKPTNAVAHGGGARFAPGSAAHARLLAWIRAGTPATRTRRLAEVTVTPADTLLPKPGRSVPLRVIARYGDGTREDVTPWALFTSNDDGVATVDPSGRVTARRPGATAVMVRYLGAVKAARVAVPFGAVRGAPNAVRGKGGRQLSRTATAQRLSTAHGARRTAHASAASFIDSHVDRQLARMRIPASPPADDATFLRRVSLDLTGTLPAPAAVRAFLADPAPDKRARQIDALLARPEYVDHWTYKLGDLFRISSRRLGEEGARAFHGWVREQVARNTPFDQLSRSLLLGLGDSHVVGPANFARSTPDARAQAEAVGQLFMGARLQCASCHKHPFDRWTQEDYHGLAAAFARLERGREVKLLDRGEVTHPRTGRDARPTLPGGRAIPTAGDRRRAVADWLTAPENPYFARATVNRIWKEMMGRGLVEPVDDMRESNPPTNPELLAALARDFTRHRASRSGGFDVKLLLRRIAASRAYQRSAVPLAGNRADDRFYSHSLPRPLPAPVLLDAIAAVTGVPEAFPGLPEGTRALQLGDSRVPSPALDVLGRCARETACDPSEGAAGGLAQALHLLNGATLNDRLSAPGGRVARWAASPLPPAALVTEIYLSALSRPPTRQEREHWARLLSSATNRRPVLEDMVWALLNSREFVFNH